MKSVHAGIGLLLAVALSSGPSNAQGTDHHNKNVKNKELTMSATEKNKAVITKLYEECLNKKNMGLLKELIAEDYTGEHGERGPAGFEAPLHALIQAFPDARWELKGLIAEGNNVVVQQQLKATHTGTFQKVAASGKAVTNDGVAVYELKDGKVIGVKLLTDRLGFLQELGVLPSDLGALAARQNRKGQIQFIDKFFVPAAARKEFVERTVVNRDFIKKLPGFIEDAAYAYSDAEGNLICITVAQWESKEALNSAKEAVQMEYKKEGFNPGEMMQRLKISADRGIYTELAE